MPESVRLRSLCRDPGHLLALGFGSGLSPVAPGTCGTFVGVGLYLLLARLGMPGFVIVVTLLAGAGVWLCGRTARKLAVHDHPAIVWDEVVGYQVAMIGAPAGWVWILLGFGLFRLFDIAKPWPVSALDRGLRGGAGIMLDDLAAGLMAACSMQLIHYLL